MKKILALVFLMGGLAVLPGCYTERCQGDSRRFIDVQGLTARNISRPDTSFNYYTNFYPVNDSTITFDAKRFGVELESKVAFYAMGRVSEVSFGSALACSPTIAGEMGSKEIISNIKITSNSDFDSAHPAGTELNNYFKVSAAGSNFSTIDDSLKTMTIPLTDFVNSGPKARRALQFWLLRTPELAKHHRFTIKYTQTNGEEYIVEAPKAIFQ